MKKRYIETRIRKTFRLTLNTTNAVEASLIEVIAGLKQQRRFATVLRNGLRLMLSLMEAEQDLTEGASPAFNAASLLEVLFPKTVLWIGARQHNYELERVRAELAELKARMDMPNTAVMLPRFQPLMDEEDTILITKDTSIDPAQNFLTAMLGMNGK